jgi:DNA repair protein RadC
LFSRHSACLTMENTDNTTIYKETAGIRSWAEEDRPREKLLLKGAHVLSDAELIAILIGSGVPGESAVDVSKTILKSTDNNLNELGKLTVRDLMKFKGIGEAKAITIVAALELAKRRRVAEVKEKEKIGGSKDVYEYFHHLADLRSEEFWVMYLNRANKIISAQKISQGGITGTVADIRLILKSALDHFACGIILCHNHPSGNLTPSSEDKSLTQKIKQAAQLLDINTLDHLIISDNGYFSFADEGLL